MSELDFEKLLARNNEHLSKLNDIVQQTLKEEESLVDKLLHPEKEKLSFAENLSDKIARFGGSWHFIIFFGIILFCWVLFNIFSPYKFDAYPFILLNLLLGGVAALQAPFIMMSQNRQVEKDRLKTDNDYMINLKAELEIRSLHQKINIMMQDQSKTMLESQALQVRHMNEISEKSFRINEQHTKVIEELIIKVNALLSTSTLK
ncbi:MAG: DUF1003 domain-containing protein [Saprospiraceae bacterium]|nr:DUF1003 domain-containing protein [Saprospiraceae bacterium]MBK7736722.1 DUF1003 domain-containing protein [Saprospiraceae bacterium]MBK7911915.1 DUF1003 domain-containing protein [Saprospiraceae bacterium]